MPYDSLSTPFRKPVEAGPGLDLHVPLLLGVLDGLNHGLVLATADGRPLFVNHSARRLLKAADGVSVSGGRLVGSAFRDTERLRTAISGALALEGAPTACLQLTRSDGRRPILASVSAARTPDGEPSKVAVIVLRDCDADTSIDAAVLAEAYRLTRRESAVAALVASGKDPQGAARTLDLGVGTVRNHLKRVFDKMGVSKQSQLASRAYAIAGAQQ